MWQALPRVDSFVSGKVFVTVVKLASTPLRVIMLMQYYSTLYAWSHSSLALAEEVKVAYRLA